MDHEQLSTFYKFVYFLCRDSGRRSMQVWLAACKSLSAERSKVNKGLRKVNKGFAPLYRLARGLSSIVLL
jgi:hypothetical protein